MWLSELHLLFRRRRTVVLLSVLAAVPVLSGIALRFFGAGGGGGNGPAFLSDVTHNGIFVALTAFAIVIVFLLPLCVSMVSGDMVAGEASQGTLRYLLIRPAGRTRLLAAKFATTVVFCLAAALTVAIAGLVVGAILFPLGRVTTISGFSIPLSTGILRTFEAAGVVGVSMIGLAAVGLFISTLTESAWGAMGATLVVFIAAVIANSVPQLHAIQPYLFLNHWQGFVDLLRLPVGYGSIESNLLLQACWAAVFLLAAWARFTRTDVLS